MHRLCTRIAEVQQRHMLVTGKIYSDPKSLELIKNELPKSYKFYAKLLEIAVEVLKIG